MRQGTRLRSAGFTLVELVLVLVIVGALSVFALPRLLAVNDFRLLAYADELAVQTLAMHRLAHVQRRPVVATFNTTGVSFAYEAGGSLLSLPCPSGNSPCLAEAGPRTATFNALNSGSTSTSTAAALAVTIVGAGVSLRYQLEAETGLFHALP